MIQYEDLVKGYQQTHDEDLDVYKNLLAGQHPIAIVITCSDSRIDPALIMHCGPGEIFVMRNIANLIPPYDEKGVKYSSVGAVLRYGVMHLNVKHIIVMGHSQCGGIKARLETLKSGSTEEYISEWLEIVKPVAEQVLQEHAESSLAEQANICEKESVKASLDHLMTYPWIKEKVDRNVLMLHGWHFDLATASISEV
jgi:carbonic anhydrase